MKKKFLPNFFLQMSLTTWLRLFGVLITLAAIVLHYMLPPKRRIVLPTETIFTKTYGFDNSIYGLSGKFIDKKNNIWLCNYREEDSFGCGFSIFWDKDFAKGVDLTAYNGIIVDLAYEGPANKLRIYMRNFNAGYAQKGDGESNNYMSMIINIDEVVEGGVYIDLSEFSVAEWWLLRKLSNRKWPAPEFTQITQIGVDLIEPGLHTMHVKKIELVGEWIKTETLLFFIVSAWMVGFLMEGIARFYALRKDAKYKTKRIKELNENRKLLEEEKQNLKNITATDPLTGIKNRIGISEIFNTIIAQHKTEEIGLLLIDLDYFKKINDTYGHDVGDRILKMFADIISANLRENDFFGRWGGEEFILLTKHKQTKNNSANHVVILAHKFRELAAQHVFKPNTDLALKLTISIGTTLVRHEDSVESAFKRADNALYQAKNNGRNRVEYQD
jgi:diguanylate cyclase (GGDEF)-like protein